MPIFTTAIEDSRQTNFPFLAIVFEGKKAVGQFPCATRHEAELGIHETIRTLETAVTIDNGDDAKDALDRISIPKEVLDRIAPTALPRSAIEML